jgi:hypothetical protein
MPQGEIFSIDTSAIIDLWRGIYARDVFRGAWQLFEQALSDGTIIAPDEVYHELVDADDDLSEWAKSRRDTCHPLDDGLQGNIRVVMAPFPQAASLPQARYADPIVVALARLRGCSAVSQETKNDLVSNPNGLPAIPNYCDRAGIRHVKLLRLFRELGWTF